MATDAAAAGRKGGSRNTPAQQAARKRNGQLHGFQKAKPVQQIETQKCHDCAATLITSTEPEQK